MASIIVLVLLLGLFFNHAVTCSVQEAQALLNFKSEFTETGTALSSWESGTECCQWTGITCNSEGAVIFLNLTAAAASLVNGQGEDLSAVVSGHLSKLRSLRLLDLSNINFSSTFPAFGTLALEYLSLSNCNLVGQIPPSISSLSATLRHLDISFNFLDVDAAQFSSTICNLVNLRELVMVGSPDVVETIPLCLSKLTNLQFLDMSSCEISGSIPSEMRTLTSLKYMDLSNNALVSGLDVVCSFRKIEYLFLDMAFDPTSNTSLPDCIGNLTSAVELRLSNNYLVGTIPDSIGGMVRLRTLALHGNTMITPIPASLGNLVTLRTLILNRDISGGSVFTGFLPQSLGNLSRLETLEIASPGSLDDDATIPASFGGLRRLQTMVLSGLGLRGEIPEVLFGSANENLQSLDLSSNSLVGSISRSIGALRNLQTLTLFENRLSGEIPSSIGNLRRVSSIDLSGNMLTGVIPGSALSGLTLLQNLDLSENRLSGAIPAEIGGLIRLTWLDLSTNQFSGRIPDTFQRLSALQFFSVASNNLTGPIPPVIGSFDALSFAHNRGLCDFPLPPCSSP